jgi:hypothetical protein
LYLWLDHIVLKVVQTNPIGICYLNLFNEQHYKVDQWDEALDAYHAENIP